MLTTSYDLILYWSHMWAEYKSTKVVTNIVDLFWATGNRFDPTDTVVRSSTATRVTILTARESRYRRITTRRSR